MLAGGAYTPTLSPEEKRRLVLAAARARQTPTPQYDSDLIHGTAPALTPQPYGLLSEAMERNPNPEYGGFTETPPIFSEDVRSQLQPLLLNAAMLANVPRDVVGLIGQRALGSPAVGRLLAEETGAIGPAGRVTKGLQSPATRSMARGLSDQMSIETAAAREVPGLVGKAAAAPKGVGLTAEELAAWQGKGGIGSRIGRMTTKHPYLTGAATTIGGLAASNAQEDPSKAGASQEPLPKAQMTPAPEEDLYGGLLGGMEAPEPQMSESDYNYQTRLRALRRMVNENDMPFEHVMSMWDQIQGMYEFEKSAEAEMMGAYEPFDPAPIWDAAQEGVAPAGLTAMLGSAVAAGQLDPYQAAAIANQVGGAGTTAGALGYSPIDPNAPDDADYEAVRQQIQAARLENPDATSAELVETAVHNMVGSSGASSNLALQLSDQIREIAASILAGR